MFCGKCGNKLESGEVYCGKCGTRVSTDINGEKNASNIKEPIKIKFNHLVTVIIIIAILVVGGVFGGIYYHNITINDEYLTESFKKNGFSQFDDVKVKALDIEDVKYKNFNKLVLASVAVNKYNQEATNVGLLLVNKKENKVEGFTIDGKLLLLLKGIANNDKSKLKEITQLSAKYIQMIGTDIFQKGESTDFENLLKEYSKIIGLKKCKEYIKIEFAKQTNTNLNYTILFKKNSPLVKYVAFYETTTKYNTNYPLDEKTFEYFKKDYSHQNAINTMEYLYGPAYTTVQEYTVYEIGKETNSIEEFEKTKVGSYSTLEKAKEKLNVEE